MVAHTPDRLPPPPPFWNRRRWQVTVSLLLHEQRAGEETAGVVAVELEPDGVFLAVAEDARTDQYVLFECLGPQLESLPA